ADPATRPASASADERAWASRVRRRVTGAFYTSRAVGRTSESRSGIDPRRSLRPACQPDRRLRATKSPTAAAAIATADASMGASPARIEQALSDLGTLRGAGSTGVSGSWPMQQKLRQSIAQRSLQPAGSLVPQPAWHSSVHCPVHTLHDFALG